MLMFISFMIAVLIGSLLPDADCGGKATLYYRFPAVDMFMKKVVGKSVIFAFNILISKKKIKTEHSVGDEHRGVIHSPVGILLSSLMLMIPLLIFGLVFSFFNWMIMLSIFFGLLIGQLLHLFEDSCTISGINWFFPFKTKELKGKIYTFSKDPERKDIRPMIYAGIFYLLVGLLVVGYAFELINGINFWLISGMITIYNGLALFVIYKLSQSTSRFWMFKKETIRKINKHSRRMQRNAGHF